MKKIILILICFLPLMAFSQYRAFTGNWDFVGMIKMSQPLTIDTTSLSATDIQHFKTSYETISDTISIDSVAYLSAEVLTLRPILNPPDTPVEGMIYVDTDHHIYYYNGTAWKQLDN